MFPKRKLSCTYCILYPCVRSSYWRILSVVWLWNVSPWFSRVCLLTDAVRCVAVACISVVQSLTSHRSSPGPCGFFGGQSGFGTGWSLLQIFHFSPVCIIPSILLTRPSQTDAIHSNLCNWQRRLIRHRPSQWLYLLNFWGGGSRTPFLI